MAKRKRGSTTIRIMISLTVDELEAIDAAADLAGLDRSSFLRSTALSVVRGVETVREKYAPVIQKIGGKS